VVTRTGTAPVAEIARAPVEITLDPSGTSPLGRKDRTVLTALARPQRIQWMTSMYREYALSMSRSPRAIFSTTARAEAVDTKRRLHGKCIEDIVAVSKPRGAGAECLS
jgi:hypothetical protein